MATTTQGIWMYTSALSAEKYNDILEKDIAHTHFSA